MSLRLLKDCWVALPGKGKGQDVSYDVVNVAHNFAITIHECEHLITVAKAMALLSLSVFQWTILSTSR